MLCFPLLREPIAADSAQSRRTRNDDSGPTELALLFAKVRETRTHVATGSRRSAGSPRRRRDHAGAHE